MRAALVVFAVGAMTAIAAANPPAGYRCRGGTPVIGTGCACGAGFASERDTMDFAVCTPARHAGEDAELAAAAGTASTYLACGRVQIDAYNALPTAPDGDDKIFAAGVCFAAAGEIGPAVQALMGHIRAFPRSSRHADVLARLARLYDDVSYYDKAIPMYEELGTPESLARAIALRVGTRDADKARDDAKQFASKFGAAHPAEADAVEFALLGLATDDAALVNAAGDYLARHGDHASAAHVTIASARLGAAMWRLACPVPAMVGACVERVGDRILAHVRGERALPWLRKAIAAYDGSAEARAAYASARVIVVDADLEAYLAGDRTRSADAIAAAYADVTALGDADAAASAASHTALLRGTAPPAHGKHAEPGSTPVILLAAEGIIIAPGADKLLARFVEADRTHAWTQNTCAALEADFSGIATAEAAYMQGLVLERCGRPADGAYARALELKADLAEARSNLARLELLAGKTEAARGDYQKAMQTNGKLIGVRLGLAALSLGDLLAAKDRTAWNRADSDARFQLANALALDPTDERAHLMFAQLDLAAGRLELGEAHVRGTSAAAQVVRGAFAWARGRTDEATRAFADAVAADPDLAAAQLDLGLALLDRDPHAAQEHLDRAAAAAAR